MDKTIDTHDFRFRWIKWFDVPIHALPLDLWRVITGAICGWYFLRTLFESKDYSSLHGLIDHELSAELFPFTWLTLFNSSLPGAFWVPARGKQVDRFPS